MIQRILTGQDLINGNSTKITELKIPRDNLFK